MESWGKSFLRMDYYGLGTGLGRIWAKLERDFLFLGNSKWTLGRDDIVNNYIYDLDSYEFRMLNYNRKVVVRWAGSVWEEF